MVLRIIFKIIFRIVKIAIVVIAILYPLVVLHANPITFYLEKINLLWETIKNFPYDTILDSIKNGGFLKS